MMNMKELIENQKMVSSFVEIFKDFDKPIIQFDIKSMELNSLLQRISLLDLPDEEWQVLVKNINELLSILHVKYDSKIQEKLEKGE